MIAFGADEKRREHLLANLSRAVEEGRFGAQAEGATGDYPIAASEALAGEGEGALARLEAESGFPPAVARLLDFVTGMVEPDEGVRTTQAWLTAPRVGAKLDGVPSRIMLELLSAPDVSSRFGGMPDALASYRRLISLHGGSAASAAEWREVRKGSVALAASAVGADRDWLTVLQTAAWPADRAPELACDVAWSLVAARQADIARDRGLPPAQSGDEDLPQRVVDELVEGGLEASDAYGRLEQVIEERRPDFAVRARGLSEIMRAILPGNIKTIDETARIALREA